MVAAGLMERCLDGQGWAIKSSDGEAAGQALVARSAASGAILKVLKQHFPDEEIYLNTYLS